MKRKLNTQANPSTISRPKLGEKAKRPKEKGKMDGNRNKAEGESFSQSDTGADLSTLPEACMVYVLALTSPRDVCRMRAVAPWLLPALESDALWLRFLPDDYLQILARSAESSSSRDFSSKKELFFSLCDSPLLIDEGKKMFWLEKRSGKKCYMLAARELTITWGDTPQYWTWLSISESRFSEIAYLNAVCWLQIKGMINAYMLSQGTNYAAYLVFNMRRDSYGFGDVAVKSWIKFDGDKTTIRKSYLEKRRMNGSQLHSSQEYISYPTKRKDGWLEIELGEFFSKGGEDHIEAEITQLGGHWKSGLMVEGIEIRPKDNL